MDKANREIVDPVERAALQNAIKNYQENRKDASNPQFSDLNNPSKQQLPDQPQTVNLGGFKTEEDLQRAVQQSYNATIDPDLTVGFEIVPLPSKGLYYSVPISEVRVDYMTSKDEDILSTASLIENGTVLDVLLKNKVKTQGVDVDNLLVGDRNAILLFLRASSYGSDYSVKVTDPRTGLQFDTIVDLTRLKQKEMKISPDQLGEFSFMLPVRKKLVKFKILNYKEVNHVLKTAEAKQDAYGMHYSEFGTMKLKAEITEVDGKRAKDYIVSFVDAMPARDSSELKKKIQEVTPDIDMNYEFTAADGFKFKARISVGVDFFFPFI